MSRYSEGDWEGTVEEILAWGRFEANLERALRGKRGQVVLAEMEEALLAMPEQKLTAGDLATPEGEVCAVGALVAHKVSKTEGVSFHRRSPQACRRRSCEVGRLS